MRECHPTGGGVLEGYASGAQGPVGALSEAREYEDRCVRSTALGSSSQAAWAASPWDTAWQMRATTMHCTGNHHSLPQPPPAGSLANSNIVSYHP